MINLPRPLLVLGSARSGTTLFQRLLNSYDDVMIWGEHDGFLEPVAKSYFSLKDSPSMKEFSYPQALGPKVDIQEYKRPDQWQAWNNWFRPEDLNPIYRNLLEHFFISSWSDQLNYWGFKEIRYSKEDSVVDFILSINPDSKAVIIFRNPLNVIESQLGAFAGIGGRLEKVRKILILPKIVKMALEWKKMNQGFLDLHRTKPECITIFSYENFISKEGVKEAVFEKLGLKFTE